MNARFFSTTGKRLRLLRDHLDLNQEEIARRAGIRQSYLSAIENDNASPSGEIIARLARVLDTTTDFLLLLTDDPEKPSRNDGAQEIIGEFRQLIDSFEIGRHVKQISREAAHA